MTGSRRLRREFCKLFVGADRGKWRCRYMIGCEGGSLLPRDRLSQMRRKCLIPLTSLDVIDRVGGDRCVSIAQIYVELA